jgi:hypothetical protein
VREKGANSQWKLIVNKSSTTSKEKESFKVSWWLILVDIMWSIGVLPIMSKLSQHKEEGKEEQIEVTHDLHREKGKEVSTEASSASTPIPKLPRGNENSLLLLLDEQTVVIKAEKLSKYSPLSILVHDSLPNEKLVENSQSNLPQSVNIMNYLLVGRIHYLWSKRRKDWCFKFKLKSYYQQCSSSPGAQAHLPRLVVLKPLHALKIHIF